LDGFVTTQEQSEIGKDQRRRKNTSLWLAVVVAFAVLAVSFLPVADKRKLHSGGRLHSWGHLVVFSVVGFVAARTAHSLWARIAVFAGAIVFGLGIEVGEHLVFGNVLEWKDVLVDALGVIAGTLLAIVFTPRRFAATTD
jgi:drug/metabolite transporter (DMT)-like permease